MVRVSVHVYDDGDIELTHLSNGSAFNNDLVYTDTEELCKELYTYGPEKEEVDEAIAYILKAQPGETCVIGKI